MKHIQWILVALTAAIFPQLGNAADSLPSKVEAEAKALIGRLDPEAVKSIRDSSELTLQSYLLKPGFMQVQNGLAIEAIPQWGLHNKGMVADCVVSLANARLKGLDFDLLAFLESTASRFDLNANFPLEFEPHKVPQGYTITNVMFRVSLEGEISALYICTNTEQRKLLVNEIHGTWRKPTPIEENRILEGHRSVSIGVPFDLE